MSESDKLTYRELKESHPSWAKGNIEHALSGYSIGSDEFIKRMTLLSYPCMKCGDQMGEHGWLKDRFVCPTREEVEVVGPSGNKLSTEETEKFLKSIQKGVFYVGQ